MGMGVQATMTPVYRIFTLHACIRGKVIGPVCRSVVVVVAHRKIGKKSR